MSTLEGHWVTEREFARIHSLHRQTLCNWRYEDRKAGRDHAEIGYPQYRRFGRGNSLLASEGTKSIMKKVSKSSVLYIHLPATEYQCLDCTMLHAGADKCSIHQRHFRILKIGSCGLFYYGPPAGKGFGYLTTVQTGYEENTEGFSCKRCSRFLAERLDCRHVDKNSPGDDPGKIHPDACCNDWRPILNLMKRLRNLRIRLLRK